MPKIRISGGWIKYKVHPLYFGVKRINKLKSEENLLLLKNILDNMGVQFGLIAGTLLGAVREKDFISHDEDVDVFVLEENKEAILNLLPILIMNGFEIARYDHRGLLSIIKNGEYIDLYLFKKDKDTNFRSCCGWIIPSEFLENTTQLLFKGTDFTIPKDYERYLIYEYGYNWQTPIPWTDFKVSIFKRRIFELKEKIKYSLPKFIFNKFSQKKENIMREKYKVNIQRYINELNKNN